MFVGPSPFENFAASSNHVAISANGRFVVFDTARGDLVANDTNAALGVFLRTRVAGTTERIDAGPAGVGFCGQAFCKVSLSSDDGRHLAFVTRSALVRGDNKGLQLPMGVQPSLSADGRLVALHGVGPERYANERVYVHELGGTGIWSYRVVGGSDFGPRPSARRAVRTTFRCRTRARST